MLQLFTFRRITTGGAVLGLACAVLSATAAPNISTLGKTPDWSALEKYQETITRDEFVRALETVYCTRGVGAELIAVEPEAVRIATDRSEQGVFTLRFAPTAEAKKPVPRDWRPAETLRKAPSGHELEGVKIAIDPGHIGGRWAKMEERWFQVGDSKPIKEGDMTLLVAKLLVPKLQSLGATTSLVRDNTEPVTPKRPSDLTDVSRSILRRSGESAPRKDYSGPADPGKERTLRWQNELLFYRNSEIRQRAELVNTQIRPDVTLCLHFNAEAWDDPVVPKLTGNNHLHMLVNGSYLSAELEFDDVRFEMLRRLLSRTHEEEIPLAEVLGRSMAQRTGLPPYQYTTDNVARIGDTGYVYARNLSANRLYNSPVVYFEPYVMNSDEVFWRVQEGDYEGLRNVNGTDRPSIFREYADAVVDGLVEYYRHARADAP